MAQWPNRTLGRRRRPHSQALKPYRGPIQGPKPTHSNGRAEKRPSVFSPMLGAHLPLRANPGSPARSLPVVPPLPSAAGNPGAPPCAVSPISTPSGTLPVGIARRYTPFALEYGHFPLASRPNRRRDCHGPRGPAYPCSLFFRSYLYPYGGPPGVSWAKSLRIPFPPEGQMHKRRLPYCVPA